MDRPPTAAQIAALEADPAFNSILEDLYTEAQLAQNRKPRKVPDPASRNSLPDTAETLRRLFADPENWQRTHGVALIHAETQTLIGNFSEYVHRTAKGCRKLVREDTPIAVACCETVSGDWWIGVDRRPEALRPWTEQRLAMIKLHLPDLGVFSPLAEVRACLEHGGIMRCELVAETLFADSDGRQLLTLAAGTNVLPVMTLDGKITLRREIGL